MLPKHLQRRLDAIIPYVQHTRLTFDKPQPHIRLSTKMPAHVRPLWPCACGREHSLIAERRNGTTERTCHTAIVRLSRRDAPAKCKPLYALRELTDYIESVRPELIHSHRRREAHIAGGEAIYMAEPRVNVLTWLDEHDTKPQPKLADVRKPSKGGVVNHRRQRNMVESEIAAVEQQLRGDYPAERGWEIIKTGGTPDFMLVNKRARPRWKVEWAEVKLIPDTLREDTQAAVMEALHFSGQHVHVYPVRKVTHGQRP